MEGRRSINCNDSLWKRISDAAEENGLSISAFLRLAAIEKMKKADLDAK